MDRFVPVLVLVGVTLVQYLPDGLLSRILSVFSMGHLESENKHLAAVKHHHAFPARPDESSTRR